MHAPEFELDADSVDRAGELAETLVRDIRFDIQTLLEGAAYKPDLLSSRESRQWVKQRVLIFFILTLVFGTSALAGASFATQVILTEKAAASVIDTSSSPGLAQ